MSCKTSPSKLISRYGLKKVEMLEQYLYQALNQSINDENFQDALALKERISVLESQNNRHYQYRKNRLVSHIMNILENEAVIILKQFQQQWTEQIQQLQTSLSQLREQLYQIHKIQIQQEKGKLSKKKERLHPNSSMLRLQDQIDKLLKNQDYLSAERVKKQLQKVQTAHHKKQLEQIRKWNQKSIKIIEQKYRKEQNAMKIRSQKMLLEQISHKQKQLSEMIAKIRVILTKMNKDLNHTQKYEYEINRVLQIHKNRQHIRKSYHENKQQHINSSKNSTCQQTKRKFNEQNLQNKKI